MNTYKSQLTLIEVGEKAIAYQQSIVDRNRLKLFGKEDSMFYGLKYPSLYKICEYIADKYNVPYDLMMDMLYKMVIKNYKNNNLTDMISRMPPMIYGIGDVVEERYTNYPLREINGLTTKNGWVKRYIGRDFVKHHADILYFGKWKYTTKESYRKNYYSVMTYKNKGDRRWYKTKSKKEVMDYLDKLDIKYKKSMKKQELYTLLIKNRD